MRLARAELVYRADLPERYLLRDAYLVDSPRFRAQEQHDWAELFIDGKWWLVDAQRRVFTDWPKAHYFGFRVASPRSDKNPELRRFSATKPLVVEMP